MKNYSTNYEVKVGEEFTIELEANWSTGYYWHWTNNSQITLADSPGMELWRF